MLGHRLQGPDVTVDDVLAATDAVAPAIEIADSRITDWKVTLAYTGELTMTGGRIARAAERYLGNAEHYAVTYGDGLTNADLATELDFH